MKIIKRGIPPELPKPVWIGKSFKCLKCETVIKLEAGDYIWVNLDGSADYTCPICYHNIIIIKSEIKK